jgi:signal transduction histidine kinase
VLVRDLLESTEPVVLPQLRAKKQELVVDKPAPDVAVHADADKVRQILLNLLSNAIKFTPPHTRIMVTVREAGPHVRISVEDSGAGIPEDKLATIFEPFVQLDRALTSDQHGAGLGLSISRDLARAMNGELVAESTVGHGSKFTLVLPSEPRD